MNWLWLILIAALIYIGIDYGRMVYKTRIAQEEVYQLEPYVPIRNIFVAQQGSQHIQDLIMSSYESHIKNGDMVKSTMADEDKGYTHIWFKSGDEIVSIRYQEDMSIARMKGRKLTDYINRVFFDDELPDSAIRDTVAQLGLKKYMFSFGLVQKEKENG